MVGSSLLQSVGKGLRGEWIEWKWDMREVSEMM